MRIFVSYSHVDRDRWRSLKTHLIPLEQEGLMKVWYDDHLEPGDEWQKRLESEIAACDVFLPLLSADFNASDYCRAECAEALKRAAKGEEIRIIPVLLRECDWEKADFGRFQGITNDDQPLVRTDNDLDHAGTLLCRKLKIQLEIPTEVPQPHPAKDPSSEDQLRSFAWSLLGLERGAADAVERYIDLTLSDVEGNQRSWGEVLINKDGRSHLVYADSGYGKTTLLKQVALKMLQRAETSDGPIPLYIHLSSLEEATVEKALTAELLPAHQLLGPCLPDWLRRLRDEGRVIFLLDGYDQVAGEKALRNVDAGCGVKVVATRTPPGPAMATWENKSYNVWKLDSVTPEQLDEYFGSAGPPQWVQPLRKKRLTRKLLRIPLFLEMLSRIGPEDLQEKNATVALIIERYWDWQIYQENQSRSKVPALPTVNEAQWNKISRLVSDCAWRLALEGYIQRFTEPVADHLAPAVTALRKAVRKANLRNFDFVSINEQGGRFRHQALQAYWAAKAVADELKIVGRGPAPIRDQIIESLGERFPERLIPDRASDPQLSFWLEAFGLVPSILRRSYTTGDGQVSERDWDSAIWFFVRNLIERGLFLLAWRIVLSAQEEADVLSSGNGWREILWQLVRYRRDSEDHFPKQSEAWHFDPLVIATIALDQVVAKGEDEIIRKGLERALRHVPDPSTQNLGAYELMVSYLNWSGDHSDLDSCRVAFILGEPDGCEKLSEARRRFLIDHERHKGPPRTDTGSRKKSAHVIPQLDDTKFGKWLEERYVESDRPQDVAGSLSKFSQNYYAPDSNPPDEAFSRWLGKSYVAEVLNGAYLPLDVSLRIFDANWTRGVSEAVEVHTDKVASAVLERLASPSIEDKIVASVLSGGLANAFRGKKSELDKLKEPAWSLFQKASNPVDVELAYTGYHEATRFVTDPGKIREIQDHIKRYYAQEIRWHDPYISSDFFAFHRKRMGPNSEYPRKSWFYCFCAPLLLELGTNKNGDNVDGLLDEYESRVEKPHECEALTWARNAVACMRKLRLTISLSI